MTKKKYMILIGLFLLYAAPLAGGLIRGVSFREIYRFPPLVQNAAKQASFSPDIYLLVLLLFFLTWVFVFWPGIFGFKRLKQRKVSTKNRRQIPQNANIFLRKGPLYAYAGLLLLLVSWILAWGRFQWTSTFSDYLFFPLWLGYIVMMDGVVYARRGQSMLSKATSGFWMLFPLSALTWWYFEFLNRFMQNWWYEGTGSFSPMKYVLYSSLCFSTVLPAVFETNEFLLSFDYLKRSFSRGFVIKRMDELGAFACLCGGVLSLFVMTLFPQTFFFMMWFAPFLILVGTLRLIQAKTPLRDLTRGVYVQLVSLPLSALFCGVLWELWNVYSMPKWHYSIPFVSGFKLFEMPLPGYSGYLPFGIICWFAWLILVYLLPTTWQRQCLMIQQRVDEQLTEYYVSVSKAARERHKDK